jgi:hypothetical protein
VLQRSYCIEIINTELNCRRGVRAVSQLSHGVNQLYHVIYGTSQEILQYSPNQKHLTISKHNTIQLKCASQKNRTSIYSNNLQIVEPFNLEYFPLKVSKINQATVKTYYISFIFTVLTQNNKLGGTIQWQ